MAALNYPAKPWADGDTFTDNDIEYVYVDDGLNPGYWSATTPDGVSVIISETAPPNPNAGDLWWNSNQDSGRLFIWYEDENTSQWVDASPAGAGGDGGDEYILPIASDSVLGGIKVGSGLTISGDGTLSADIQGGGGTTVGNLQEVTDEGNTTTNGATFGEDLEINGLTVGRGAGNVETNTALGQNALSSNTTGIYDIAVGRMALRSNTEGTHNIALGHASLRSNITGTYNTAVGQSAGYYIEGSNNTILGAYSGTEADSTLNDTVIISAGPTERMRIDENGDTEFYGSIKADNVTFNVEPDNDAYYTVTTSTDDEGNEVETRVYNGPTLDVKDRVMNLISRLDAIEANEVIDDATDTSLLQLVASAAARLDSIEARLTAAGI